eukprot:CAMPEP_0176472682 /NCGR_PEP_ID=MMETSP0127-20121128/41889_1 /TAXON_ID=938130 /ORGANISM="Platyophrya macrostoma, Strain WH" /LENGTH=148 /DNA_ID=CAMNT_0017867599 /DNA_START=185 /DNA_END=631 /DNA_ORIENTATION=+
MTIGSLIVNFYVSTSSLSPSSVSNLLNSGLTSLAVPVVNFYVTNGGNSSEVTTTVSVQGVVNSVETGTLATGYDSTRSGKTTGLAIGLGVAGCAIIALIGGVVLLRRKKRVHPEERRVLDNSSNSSDTASFESTNCETRLQQFRDTVA